VGLGTDGAASNNALNLLAEIQTAALIHKGVRLDPLAVPAAAALERSNWITWSGPLSLVNARTW
jgi:cytosine/adenosine deaminase-related metal-dependent hydrolase